jgi:predicted nucleic acid-binding protein
VIVVDTNVLIALADRRDAHHAQCRDWLADCDEQLVVPPTVLAEAAHVFTGPRGGRITTAVLRDATHWDEVVTELGHEHLRRHDLRHTGQTWMADAGVPVHVLRKIAGHGSLVTTQRYLHPDGQSIADAGIALSAHLKANWSPNGPQLRLVKDS